MTQLFRRACRLVVGLTAGATEALDLSDFRIRFKTNMALVGSPAHAEFYIYNLSKETIAKFVGEGQDIAFHAGYDNDLGLIFQGQVFQFRRGRESPTDTWLCVLAQCGDLAHNYAVVSGTLAAGWSMETQRVAALQAMQSHGVTAGHLSELPQTEMPRGKVLYGTSREYLDHIAQTANQEWGYDGNTVTMVSRNSAATALAFVLNTQTGMIGMPQLTSEGLQVTSLLNARLAIGGQVQVNESSVQFQAFDVSVAGQANNAFIDPKQALGADGFYNIIGISHSGDTRGATWQTDVVGWGVGAIAPITGPMVTGAAGVQIGG